MFFPFFIRKNCTVFISSALITINVIHLMTNQLIHRFVQRINLLKYLHLLQKSHSNALLRNKN